MKEQYEVKRLDRPVDWTVDVPGSKSMTNRALLMAALSDGEVKLEGVLFSDDSRHFLESLVSLGFMVDINESEKAVTVLGWWKYSQETGSDQCRKCRDSRPFSDGNAWFFRRGIYD